MADGTGIQWTDATWNPTTGCSKISPGCTHCYAETMATRLQKMGQKKYENAFKFTNHYNELDKPFKWKKPKKIFVDSMSDLFHEDSSSHFNILVFETMLRASHHTYQILTKRAQRMADFVDRFLELKQLDHLPKHIWLGVSCESHQYVDRIRILKTIKVPVHFVSFEPLLGPVDIDLSGIQWAIVGGESGDGHRPINKFWVEDLLEESRASGTAFFFKQWGGRTPKSNGRELNGQIYSEFPK